MRSRFRLTAARNTLLVSDPDRLISLGRLLTACFGILAFWSDPTQPGRFRTEAGCVLAFYLLFAIFLVVVRIKRPLDSPWHLCGHIADTIILGCLAFLTSELTSPFFSFLPFTVMAMTVRWGLGGAIAGALMVEVVLYTVGIPDILDGESELNLLIVRSAFFFLAAIMLGYFGAYRESSRERLTRLAHWPVGPALGSRSDWLAELCGHAGSVTGSERMIVIWHEHETADSFVAAWRGGRVEVRDVGASDVRDGLDPLTLDAFDRGEAWVLKSAEVQAARPLLERMELPGILPCRNAVAAGFVGLRLSGAVLIVDPDCRPEDAATLCGIIATRVGAELERLDLLGRYAEIVRTEERNRLAHDLHDSVLQDLTATSLKLHALAAAAPDAREKLREIDALVIEQQRRIRHFVEGHRECATECLVEVADELGRHAEMLQRKWDVAVPFVWEGATALLPQRLVDGLTQLVSEATSNAVRHGAASSVGLNARLAGGTVELRVTDNGTGLDSGSAGSGSVSLRARLQQLGGAMSMTSGRPGLAVRLVIPVEEFAA